MRNSRSLTAASIANTWMERWSMLLLAPLMRVSARLRIGLLWMASKLIGNWHFLRAHFD